MTLDDRQRALVALGEGLRAIGYQFVTPTPETHRRVNARPRDPEATATPRDVFGWSRPFRAGRLVQPLAALAERAGVLRSDDGGATWRSAVRFSTLAAPTGDLLLAHSAYPTTDADAVFFGPDSYRFAALLGRTVWKARRLVDVGCGTGVGGLMLAARADQVVLADVNPRTLGYAAVNAALAGRAESTIELRASDVLAGVDGDIDAVIANPPYLVDPGGRLYRDGGGALGLGLAERIVGEALERLTAGGQLVLYTGSPVVDGRPLIRDLVEPALGRRAASWSWEELDPDVFGEELAEPAYAGVERIAVLGLTAIVG